MGVQISEVPLIVQEKREKRQREYEGELDRRLYEEEWNGTF